MNKEIFEKETTKLNEEELNSFAGGSIDNVNYTETIDISDDTKEKIQ